MAEEPKIAHTAEEYATLLGAHEGHDVVRADDPWKRRMGRRCNTDGATIQIAIKDFKSTGDLEAFTKALEPFQKKPAEKPEEKA